jgi:hypothetical protein
MSDDLRDLAKAATAGPWYVGAEKLFGAFDIEGPPKNDKRRYIEITCEAYGVDNAAYIAAANPAAVLALLEERDQLTKDIAAGERRLASIREGLAMIRELAYDGAHDALILDRIVTAIDRALHDL